MNLYSRSQMTRVQSRTVRQAGLGFRVQAARRNSSAKHPHCGKRPTDPIHARHDAERIGSIGDRLRREQPSRRAVPLSAAAANSGWVSAAVCWAGPCAGSAMCG